jgi:hypothetical protein
MRLSAYIAAGSAVPVEPAENAATVHAALNHQHEGSQNRPQQPDRRTGSLSLNRPRAVFLLAAERQGS